jgi:hypothetical protein
MVEIVSRYTANKKPRTTPGLFDVSDSESSFRSRTIGGPDQKARSASTKEWPGSTWGQPDRHVARDRFYLVEASERPLSYLCP